MPILENHPHSALTKQIEQLLWASVILSCAVAAVSLVNMGRLSLFMVPIFFSFTLLHHGIVLGCINRDRKKEPEALKGTLAPTAKKASIIFCWILAALWCLSVVAVIITSVLIMSMNQYEGWERLAGYLEIPFEVAEISLLIVLALKCKKQRRLTLVEPANVDWQNYQATASAAVA